MNPPRDLADCPSQLVAGLSYEERARQLLLRPLHIAFEAFALSGRYAVM